MASISNYAGSASAAFISNTGTKTFPTPSNATGAPNGSPYAVAANLSSNSTASTKSLDTYNYGFSFTAGTTFQGFLVTMTAHGITTGTSATTITSCNLEIGSSLGTPGSGSNGTVLTSSDATYTWGGSNDLWGLSSTLTVSNLNSATEGTGPTIGVVFSLHNDALNDGSSASVDAIQLTIYYTLPPTSAVVLTSLTGCPLQNGNNFLLSTF
jgi:hypothetical protein